jgi:hypothetical protein
MGEEDKVQEPQPPVEEAGSDEVSPSWKEALGSEEVREEAAAEAESSPQAKPTYTPEEHRERTGLGRKVSQHEQEMAKLRQDFNQLASLLAQRQEPYMDRAMSQPVEEKPPVEYITTPDDLEKHLAWRQAQEERKRNAYTQRYVHSVKTMTYMNSDMHQDIEKELLTNVGEYPTHTGHKDPVFDARENYLRAENKLLKQRLAGAQVPRPNVKGGTSVPAGVSATSRMNAATKETVRLDEHASRFIKALGESEDAEWVQKSVGRKD